MATTRNGKLTIYYHPFSYFSQRVLLTLEEKGLEYEEEILDPHSGDNKEPWYLQINPKGEVPTVTFNGQNVPDSNTIVDFLDEQFSESPRLQPDEESADGQNVRRWRNRINDVVIEIISYGCIYHRDLTRNSKVPAAATKLILGNLKLSDEMYQKYMIKYPDYKETYEMKMNKFRRFQETFSDLGVVNKEIENLDVILEEIENQLQETSQNFSEDDEYWFLGQTFTAADVFLAVLLNRLKFIGLLHHFQDSKPLLTAYYKRVQQRPSFKKACIVEFGPLFSMLIRKLIVKKIKKVVPILLGVGLIGAAMAFGYKYVKERNG
ncbi:ganglioside-induced differentiation-associated protein 1-like [Glandiceps talaboti]